MEEANDMLRALKINCFGYVFCKNKSMKVLVGAKVTCECNHLHEESMQRT